MPFHALKSRCFRNYVGILPWQSKKNMSLVTIMVSGVKQSCYSIFMEVVYNLIVYKEKCI